VSYKQRPSEAQARLLMMLSKADKRWGNLADEYRSHFGKLDGRTIGSLFYRGWVTYKANLLSITHQGREALSTASSEYTKDSAAGAAKGDE
jgi:hypothetical protein